MTRTSKLGSVVGILLLTALSLLLLGYRLGSTGFWTDESIYAETAREMAASGDWITPRLCGEPYLIKPVLYHWLAAVSFRLLGETELAGRLPQAAAGLLGILAVTFFAWRLFGSRTGLLSGAILATSWGYTLGARVAGMDVLLTTGISWSLCSFYLGYRDSARRRAWFLASGFGAGVALLAKGPLGAAVPVMVALVFLLRRWDLRLAFSREALEGAAVGLAVASIWYLPVWIRHGKEFTRVFWIRNNLARIVEPVSEHSGSILYYLPVLFLAFLPWSFPLGWGLARALRGLFRRRAAADPAAEFLVIWLLAPLVFFSLLRTKLPGYILPIFPAAAILTAREWEKHASGGARPGRHGSFRVVCALGVASLPGVALALPFLLQHRYGIPPKQGLLFPLASFTFAALAVGSALAPRGKLRSVWWAAAAALFVLGFVRFAIVPVAPYESMRAMTARLLAKRDAGFPVALAGAHLKGTFFYTGCTVPMPRDLNDLPRPEWGPPLFCLVKDRYRRDLEAWARRGGFDLNTVERRGSLSLVEVSR